MVGRELASCTQHARLELQLLLNSDCLERGTPRAVEASTKWSCAARNQDQVRFVFERSTQLSAQHGAV